MLLRILDQRSVLFLLHRVLIVGGRFLKRVLFLDTRIDKGGIRLGLFGFALCCHPDWGEKHEPESVEEDNKEKKDCA
jgi:hypothetical protein